MTLRVVERVPELAETVEGGQPEPDRLAGCVGGDRPEGAGHQHRSDRQLRACLDAGQEARLALVLGSPRSRRNGSARDPATASTAA